jgi:hypothetical protein
MLYQLSHFRPMPSSSRLVGAESQNRTGDTVIFSHVLYQLSYLGSPVRRHLFNHIQSSPAKADAVP